MAAGAGSPSLMEHLGFGHIIGKGMHAMRAGSGMQCERCQVVTFLSPFGAVMRHLPDGISGASVPEPADLW